MKSMLEALEKELEVSNAWIAVAAMKDAKLITDKMYNDKVKQLLDYMSGKIVYLNESFYSIIRDDKPDIRVTGFHVDDVIKMPDSDNRYKICFYDPLDRIYTLIDFNGVIVHYTREDLYIKGAEKVK